MTCSSYKFEREKKALWFMYNLKNKDGLYIYWMSKMLNTGEL